MSINQKAVVAGLICLDIIPNLENIPLGEFFQMFQPGLMIQIGAPIFSTGGAVSNTGLALHILDVETNLMGKVGDDTFGQVILALLKKQGKNLADSMIVDREVTTSFTIIVSPPGLDRMFLHHPGANNKFGVEDIDFNVVEGATLFHFGYPQVMERIYSQDGYELLDIFRKVKGKGILTSLDLCFPDPNSRGGQIDWKKILSKVLPYVDIFMPSIDELLFLLRRETYQSYLKIAGSRFMDCITPGLLHEISQDVINMGAKIVLLKLGERGAYLRTATSKQLGSLQSHLSLKSEAWADQELWAPCFKVNVVGTTGSGDATIAGFLAALLRGQLPHEAITSAVAVGACNVEAADAISGIKSWDTTMNRIHTGWERHLISLDNPGWNWDNNHQLWVGPGNLSE